MRILLIIATLLFTVPAWAADIYVDADCTGNPETDYDPGGDACSGGSDTVYSTIDAAVDAGGAGDTVQVRAGTYSEGITVGGGGSGGNYLTIGYLELYSAW